MEPAPSTAQQVFTRESQRATRESALAAASQAEGLPPGQFYSDPWPDACYCMHLGSVRETPFMTSAVRDLLRSFQSLSDAEKHEAASLLLRQVVQGEAGDVGDDALVAVAEELFLDLDAREAGDGQSSPR